MSGLFGHFIFVGYCCVVVVVSGLDVIIIEIPTHVSTLHILTVKQRECWFFIEFILPNGF